MVWWYPSKHVLRGLTVDGHTTFQETAEAVRLGGVSAVGVWSEEVLSKCILGDALRRDWDARAGEVWQRVPAEGKRTSVRVGVWQLSCGMRSTRGRG